MNVCFTSSKLAGWRQTVCWPGLRTNTAKTMAPVRPEVAEIRGAAGGCLTLLLGTTVVWTEVQDSWVTVWGLLVIVLVSASYYSRSKLQLTAVTMSCFPEAIWNNMLWLVFSLHRPRIDSWYDLDLMYIRVWHILRWTRSISIDGPHEGSWIYFETFPPFCVALAWKLLNVFPQTFGLKSMLNIVCFNKKPPFKCHSQKTNTFIIVAFSKTLA